MFLLIVGVLRFVGGGVIFFCCRFLLSRVVGGGGRVAGFSAFFSLGRGGGATVRSDHAFGTGGRGGRGWVAGVGVALTEEGGGGDRVRVFAES